jgi:transcriptional regulator
VFHDDRDIEFILFKRELERLYSEGDEGSTLELDYKSCEMIADDLSEYIYDKYPHRSFTITVSEDGENGAICFYELNNNGVH